jgi:hypothetical protein
MPDDYLDAEEIEGPITVAEVASWFPKKLPAGQDSNLLAKLTGAIETTRSWLQVPENPENADFASAGKQLPKVSKAAGALKKEIKRLLDVGGKFVETNPQILSLLNEVDRFLVDAPGRQEGAPTSQWNEAAYRWAPMVAKCLKIEGGEAPSIIDKTGPVLVVLARAIKRVFGLDYDSDTISRAIERRRRKEKSATT